MHNGVVATFEFVLVNCGTMPVLVDRLSTDSDTMHCGRVYPGR